MRIRAFEASDRKAWQPLWQAYQQFYKVTLSQEVTEAAWTRIIDPSSAVEGFGAFEGEALLGFTHIIAHEETWSVNRRVYLKDLFTVPEARGKGVGRALIDHACFHAKTMGADRLWWLTHESNEQARKLYDKLAEHTGFVQYRMDV